MAYFPAIKIYFAVFYCPHLLSVFPLLLVLMYSFRINVMGCFSMKGQNPGYKQSSKWRIKKAKQVNADEDEARRLGVPVSRVIADKLEARGV